jgi:hypothetical protein
MFVPTADSAASKVCERGIALAAALAAYSGTYTA